MGFGSLELGASAPKPISKSHQISLNVAFKGQRYCKMHSLHDKTTTVGIMRLNHNNQ